MPHQDLITISLIAFGIVLVLLAILAGFIRFITLAFPARDATSDAALIAAVTTVYSALYPGTTVTNMEERR